MRKNSKNSYDILGSKFNANNLIEDLIDDDSSGLNFFDENFDFNIRINQVYLDKEHTINKLNGNLNLKKNEILNAELTGNFSKKEKLKLTIKTNESEKVTTLFSRFS